MSPRRPVFAWFLTALVAVAGRAATDELLVRLGHGGGAVDVACWSVVGPFVQTSKQEPWEQDFLQPFGATEGRTTAASFREFARLHARGVAGVRPPVPQTFVRVEGPFVDFVALFGHDYMPRPTPAVVYAACEVHSPRVQDAVLLVGSADAGKIWLNGTLLQSTTARRGVSTYDDAIPVTLREGANFLMVKVPRWRMGWGLVARFEPSRAAAATTALLSQQMLDGLLLRHCMLAEGEAVALAPRGVPTGIALPAEIQHLDGTSATPRQPAVMGVAWAPSPTLKSGLYRLVLAVGERLVSQRFVVGDPHKLGSALERRAAPFLTEPVVGIHLGALQKRLAVLLRRELVRTDRMLVHTLAELETVVTRLERAEEACRGVPGLHLRGFRSRIDGEAQHYRLFVPSCYDPRTPLPVIVFLPTVISAARPFLESAFLDAHSEAERISVIAEELGVAVLWSGYRNRPTGQPCDFTHVDETLEAVGRDYAIDSTRISLLGACSGGALATMAAVRWPERFAGVALLNPVFRLGKKLDPDEIVAFVGAPGFRSWVLEEDGGSVPYLRGAGPPTFVIHDGAEPGHGDLSVSLDFARDAHSAGFPLKFERRTQTLAQHFGAWRELMTWLAAQKRVRASLRRAEGYFPEPGRPGPIAQAFADRFVVIVGTGGTNADRDGAERLAHALREAWRQVHFGGCRFVRDAEFDAAAYADANWVLIGNCRANTIWREVAPLVGLAMDETGITWKERSWCGPISLQAIVSDPRRPGRQIVFLGADDLARAAFGSFKLSVDGWFDFAIWNHADPTRVALLEAGRWTSRLDDRASAGR